MGGTKILAAALNSSQGIVAKVKKPTELGDTSKYLNDIVEVVESVIKEANLQNNQIKAVCLGVPGSVNPYSGIIAIAPNLNISNFNIKDELGKKLPFPILIENDVNLAALGIHHKGQDENSKDLLVVYIGTGIGAGFIFDNRLFRGANYAAGEIGHILVDKNGPMCGCGKVGCFEALASRTAIARKIIKDIKNDKETILKDLVKSKKKIKSKALREAVIKKDKVVIKRITQACDITGEVLANITNLLNLDLIILGGGLIEALDFFMLPLIEDSFKKWALKDSQKGLRIISTHLGDDAALYGGIPLAKEFLDLEI